MARRARVGLRLGTGERTNEGMLYKSLGSFRVAKKVEWNRPQGGKGPTEVHARPSLRLLSRKNLYFHLPTDRPLRSIAPRWLDSV